MPWFHLDSAESHRCVLIPRQHLLTWLEMVFLESQPLHYASYPPEGIAVWYNILMDHVIRRPLSLLCSYFPGVRCGMDSPTLHEKLAILSLLTWTGRRWLHSPLNLPLFLVDVS